MRLPWRHDNERIRCGRCKPCDCVSGTESVAKSDSRGEAETAETCDEIGEEGALTRISVPSGVMDASTPLAAGSSHATLRRAGEEVRDAGDVDPQSVLAIDVPGRAVASAPTREREEVLPVSFLFGR